MRYPFKEQAWQARFSVQANDHPMGGPASSIALPYFLKWQITEEYWSKVDCIVGWVDFWLFLDFQQKYSWDLLHTFQKYRKWQKNKFWPSDRFIIGHDFLGHALYKGKNFIFTTWTSWVSKDAEFYVDIENINLP
jgi:hypothetical protein